MPNPFKPTAGKTPPVVIGRQPVMDDFARGLRNGAGARERLMLITGQRGYGKTVMLSQLEQLAADAGWAVYSETASEGLVERLTDVLQGRRTLIDHVRLAPELSIAGGASVKVGDLQLTRGEQAITLRAAMEKRLSELPDGKGVMVTIDESQAASREDLVSLATTIQHVIRDEDKRNVPDEEKRGVAFVLAALPSVVDNLINDKVLTFLRRAKREELGAVPIPDVRNSFVTAVKESGRSIGIATASLAAEMTGGNPYLVQLVGYYMYESAETRGSSIIEREDFEQGSADALYEYGETVCAPTFFGLTEMQQLFLHAMLEDYPKPASVSDVGERLGKSSGWVGKYRASLVREQVISPAGYGRVKYAIPHLGEWLRELD